MSARLVEALLDLTPDQMRALLSQIAGELKDARAALAEAEAQPVQEPVAKITAIMPTGGVVEWLVHQGDPIEIGQELYTAAPPQPGPLLPPPQGV